MPLDAPFVIFMKKRACHTSKTTVSIGRARIVFRGETTLARSLKAMGYRHKKNNDKRRYYEQPRITEQRHVYLQRLRRNRVEKRPVIYLDETWCNANDGKDKAWVTDDDITGGTLGGVKRPSGKRKRLIILHAVGEMGWIGGTELVFESKKNTGDDHDEMNSERFEKWFHDHLLPIYLNGH